MKNHIPQTIRYEERNSKPKALIIISKQTKKQTD